MALKYLRDGVDDLKETLQKNQMFDGQVCDPAIKNDTFLNEW